MATESEADRRPHRSPPARNRCPGPSSVPLWPSPVMVTRPRGKALAGGAATCPCTVSVGCRLRDKGQDPSLKMVAPPPGARGSFGERSAAPPGVPAPLTAPRAGQSLTTWRGCRLCPWRRRTYLLACQNPPSLRTSHPAKQNSLLPIGSPAAPVARLSEALDEAENDD